MKVALLMGGRSSEREISLRTGRGIAQALRNLGHEVLAVDAANGRLLPAGEEETAALPAAAVSRLPASSTSAIAQAEAINQAEVVLIALHGGAGEDGTIQALLELAGKPYTGSGVLASALAMNKAVAKRLFVAEGIPTPKWRLVRRGEPVGDVDTEALGGYPLVVKPNAEGSTVGLTIVTRPADLPEALELAGRYGAEVLIEQFIPGRELTVAVLGDRARLRIEVHRRQERVLLPGRPAGAARGAHPRPGAASGPRAGLPRREPRRRASQPQAGALPARGQHDSRDDPDHPGADGGKGGGHVL